MLWYVRLYVCVAYAARRTRRQNVCALSAFSYRAQLGVVLVTHIDSIYTYTYAYASTTVCERRGISFNTLLLDFGVHSNNVMHAHTRTQTLGFITNQPIFFVIHFDNESCFFQSSFEYGNRVGQLLVVK